MVSEQLLQVGIQPQATILEPEGRNTAPAIALACGYIAHQALLDNTLLLAVPSDHLMNDNQGFADAVSKAAALARQHIVTFGITPTEPSCQYGYIAAGEQIADATEADMKACKVSSFIEKPAADAARDMLQKGNYYWNVGMFLFSPQLMIAELEAHAPDIWHAARNAIQQAVSDMDFLRPDKTAFAGCPSNSIDYAVMEHTSRAAMLPMSLDWSDIGSWQAVYQQMPKDADQNAISGRVVAANSRDCLLWSDDRLLCAYGLHDICAIVSSDAVFIAPQSHSAQVKQMVEEMKSQGVCEATATQTSYRPWGQFTNLYTAERAKVKSLTVKPGKRLSMQRHQHRAEHWIVIAGTARIHKGEQVFTLHENESTYIAPGEMHRIENPGECNLTIIEVQSGSYLEEDDIERIADDFGRVD